jgi:hypothetical protein
MTASHEPQFGAFRQIDDIRLATADGREDPRAICSLAWLEATAEDLKSLLRIRFRSDVSGARFCLEWGRGAVNRDGSPKAIGVMSNYEWDDWNDRLERFLDVTGLRPRLTWRLEPESRVEIKRLKALVGQE